MTRAHAALAAAAVLLVFALAGCSGGATAGPSRSAGDATPTATPPPTPEPATAFGGDCGLVLTGAEVSTLIGPATAVGPFAPAPVVAAPGALACEWTSASGALTVTAVPQAVVPADAVDRYSLPECSRDTGFCGGSATAGGMWLLLDFGWLDGEWEPTVSSALKAVMRSAERHPLL